MVKFIPAIVWAVMVAVLCLLPQSAIYNPGFLHKLPADKLVHTGMFFILCFLSCRGLEFRMPFRFTQYATRILTLFILLAAYGALTELAQGWFTKTRHTELLDFVADCTGIALGFLAYLLLHRKKLINKKEYIRY